MNNRSFCNCKGDREEQKKAGATLFAWEGHTYCMRCEKCGLKLLCGACVDRSKGIAKTMEAMKRRNQAR